MEPAFWDTSAIVPVCTPSRAPVRIHQLTRRYAAVVWWAAPVEVRSAFARELRAGSLTRQEHAEAQDNLAALQRIWHEIQPSEPLRALAEELLDRYPLSAADALQLAAAYIWSEQRPFNRCFIAGDKRLLGVARSAGFRGIAVD